MDKLTNLIWAIVFIIAISLALNAAGIDLSDDYDGKQVITQLDCQKRGVKTTTKENGTFWQTELVCKERE